MRQDLYLEKRLNEAFLKAYRQENLIKQKFVCVYCYEPLTLKTSTNDHVKAKINGGLDKKGNLVTSCRNCNMLKSNSTKEEFIKKIKTDNSIAFQMLRFRRNLWLKTHKACFNIKRKSGIECQLPKMK